jgi:hypothetical protein
MPDTPTPYNIETATLRHADSILRTSGSGLSNYTMDGTRRAILSAVLDCIEEAYRAGADRAVEVMRERKA